MIPVWQFFQSGRRIQFPIDFVGGLGLDKPGEVMNAASPLGNVKRMGSKAYSLDLTYNLKPSWRGRHTMILSVTQVRDWVWTEGERMSDDSNWSSLGESETMVNWSQTRWQTSSDQRLNVSMSLAAHIPCDDALALEQYQSAQEMPVPHGRTCNIASSSSVSVGFEMVRRPSDECERMRGDDTAGWNDMVVMSSEWVEECV